MKRLNDVYTQIGEKILLRYKLVFYLLVLILTAVSIVGITRLHIDSSNESYFSDDSAVLEANQRFKSIFGNEEFVFILLEADDVFSYRALLQLQRISEDLRTKLPFIRDTLSLVDVDFSEMRNDSLFVGKLIPDPIPAQKDDLRKIRIKAHLKNLIKGRIFTDNDKYAGIFVSFENIPKEVYLPVA